MEQVNVYLEQTLNIVLEYAPKVAMALLVLVVGWFIIGRISKMIHSYFERTNYAPPEVESFIHSIVTLGLKIVLVITVAGMLGIETTSFVGILAAMGFAVGLALQGNLSNFAAGVMILIMRPFKVGDEVKINGKWMFVREIQIFHTVFRNFNNSFTIIPNGSITSGPVENLTAQDVRKLSIPVRIAYTEDFEKVKKIMFDAGSKVEGAKPDFLFVDGMKDHYVQASFIFAIPKEKYWSVEGPLKIALIKAVYDNKLQVAYPTGVTIANAGETSKAILN